MSNIDDFQANADASYVIPMQASSLRIGGFVMINDRPCKITDMSTSKTGKHGGAKVHLTGNDIFTDKKMVCIYSSTDNVDVPIVNNKEYQLLSIDDESFMSMMDEKGKQREDLKLVESDICKKIREEYANDKVVLLNVLSACGEERIVGYAIGK